MRVAAFVLGLAVVGVTVGGPMPPKVRAVQKQYQREYACNKDAKQLIAEMQENFASFADYEATLCASFCAHHLKVGQHIQIFSGVGGVRQRFEVSVTELTSNSFTFESIEGRHVLYPATISFAAKDAGSRVQMTINVDADFAKGPARWAFHLGGGQLEDRIWNHYFTRVGESCKQGSNLESKIVGRMK